MTDNPGLLEAFRAVGRSLILVEKDGRWTVGDSRRKSPRPLAERTAYAPCLPPRRPRRRLLPRRPPPALRLRRRRHGQRHRLGRDRRGDEPGRHARLLRRRRVCRWPASRPPSTACQRSLGDAPYGFNLIHSPNEPDLENAVVDLYLRRGVRLVEASAYLDLTLPVVRYRTARHPRRRRRPDRHAQPRHRQGVARRGGVASSSRRRRTRMLQELVRAGRPDAGAGRAGRRDCRWPRT